MLGNELVSALRNRHDLHVTFRKGAGEVRLEAGDAVTSHFGVDVRDFDSVQDVLAAAAPDLIINAAGVVKQRAESKDAVASIEVNSLFPHRAAVLCERFGARLIHVSTDCVFSGARGNYTEADTPDAQDLYGLSKRLGEVVASDAAVTLRTSIIGLEIERKQSLVEWFLAQEGTINGYRNAIFSGLTTMELVRVIEMVAADPALSGLYHVSSTPIDKYSLLDGLNRRLGGTLKIKPDLDFVIDRSLDSTRFTARTGYRAPSWDVMLDELANRIEERRK